MTDIDGTTFLSGANAEFIAELYARFLDDPDAVDESWRRFFAEIGDDAGGAESRARRTVLGACAASGPCGERRRALRAQRPRRIGRLSAGSDRLDPRPAT